MAKSTALLKWVALAVLLLVVFGSGWLVAEAFRDNAEMLDAHEAVRTVADSAGMSVPARVQPQPAVREIEGLWIPLSDGARLSARLWLPPEAEVEPVPAVVEVSPYRHEDHTRRRDSVRHPYFAEHGYASMRVDVRGSQPPDVAVAPVELVDWVELIKQAYGQARHLLGVRLVIMAPFPKVDHATGSRIGPHGPRLQIPLVPDDVIQDDPFSEGHVAVLHLRESQRLQDRASAIVEGYDGPAAVLAGNTCLYGATGGTLYAVAVTPTGNGVTIGTPRKLFTFPPTGTDGTAIGYTYDVTSDGRRFLLSTSVRDGSSAALVLVQNWRSEFAKK